MNFMKGNIIISEVLNDICDLLLGMNHSEEIAIYALRSLYLLDSFENFFHDTK